MLYSPRSQPGQPWQGPGRITHRGRCGQIWVMGARESNGHPCVWPPGGSKRGTHVCVRTVGRLKIDMKEVDCVLYLYLMASVGAFCRVTRRCSFYFCAARFMSWRAWAEARARRRSVLQLCAQRCFSRRSRAVLDGWRGHAVAKQRRRTVGGARLTY